MKNERESNAANPFSHLISEKWVGSVQGSQRPWRDREMSRKGKKSVRELKSELRIEVESVSVR